MAFVDECTSLQNDLTEHASNQSSCSSSHGGNSSHHTSSNHRRPQPPPQPPLSTRYRKSEHNDLYDDDDDEKEATAVSLVKEDQGGVFITARSTLKTSLTDSKNKEAPAGGASRTATAKVSIPKEKQDRHGGSDDEDDDDCRYGRRHNHDSDADNYFDDEDDDDEEDYKDYLLDSLLSRNVKSGLSLSEQASPLNTMRPRLGSKLFELERNHSARSLTNLSITNNNNALDDDDKTWNTNSSVHSNKTDLSVDKTWNTMESVHTSSSSIRDMNDTIELYGNNNTGGSGNNNNNNDSCCSFASFGGSDSSLDESGTDLSLQRAAFTRLVEAPTPRQMLMKSQSLRINRGLSFRTGLALIEESNSLD